MSHIKWQARVISPPPRSYAAIDLGTNACRLLVATCNWDNSLDIIDSHSEAIGLGENLKITGALCDSAQIRAIGSLRRIQKKIGKYNLKSIRAVATEACRQASNADVFVRRVKQQTGITLEIISPVEEAKLASDGCVALLPPTDYGVIFDIGGGSTQLILLKNNTYMDSISIPYGVITLRDYMDTHQLDSTRFHTFSKHIQSFITPLAHSVAHVPHVQLLGASGTITTLTASHLKMRHYNRRAIDGASIHMDTVLQLSEHMAKIDNRIRASEPCIGKGRAHLMPAGCVILHAICRTWYSQNVSGKILVADRGIREGILLDLMRQ